MDEFLRHSEPTPEPPRAPVRSSGDPPASAPLPKARPLPGEEAERATFVHLAVSGPDPSVDRLLWVEALRRAPTGAVERFEWSADAEEASGAQAAGAKRAWRRLTEFVGDTPWVVVDAELHGAWTAHFEGRAGAARCVLGLAEFADLWLPGRRELAGERWARELAGPARDAPNSDHARAPGDERDFGARDVARALTALARRARGLAAAEAPIVCAAAARTWELLAGVDAFAARRLELSLGFLFGRGALEEDPSRRDPADEATDAARRRSLLDSWTAGADVDPVALVRERIEDLAPRWRDDPQSRQPTVSVTGEDDLPFPDEDLALVDAIFERELAARDGADLRYRPGQHAVAREVARTLGARELLLVHAPTGTGKTLAYVVPALIWAARHEVRVGVITYTRALQEQALDREVPRALAALERALAADKRSLPTRPRVALLKGRTNYVCWRALKLHVPSEDDRHESWLAWLTLLCFCLGDDSGDLDRLPARAPFGCGDRAREERELESLLRQVRAQVGCCQRREDRETCAAEVARQRAERAHVVIANHAFALSRQAFFKHVIIDECEHLHEQAHAAWSHATSIEEARAVLGRVRQEGRSASRAPLDRLERLAPPESKAAEAIVRAIDSWRGAGAGLDELERELETFLAWRERTARERNARDEHSLLTEYVLGESSAGLVAARDLLHHGLVGLSVALADVAEVLDSIPMRGGPRLRRQLDLVRVELDELTAVLDAWMPAGEGRVQFHEHTFYDVELDARGRQVIAARVLLPNEYLGRHYYPELASAVLLSATTWLRGGFDGAKAYLGLDRAEHPAEGEEREPCRVRTFRAPDPFDYSRVLLALPSDAPSYSEARAEWSAYVRRFVAELGERTRGRMLVLFTNQEELLRVGEELSGFFSARRIPFWYQGMRGIAKEELAELFRERVDSILMGVDTFWYGADFPGETLEYLVIVKLPYGVPDRYHHAQCAALGSSEQRRRIYLPRALAKFRQGFGRLMRRETDRGCVFVLDPRARGAPSPVPGRAAARRRGRRRRELHARRRAHGARHDRGVHARGPGAHGPALKADARGRTVPPESTSLRTRRAGRVGACTVPTTSCNC